MTTSLSPKSFAFIFSLEEAPFFNGNQEGVEQAEMNRRIKRRKKTDERSFNPLKSIIFLFDNN
jgi:hypothetical protein